MISRLRTAFLVYVFAALGVFLDHWEKEHGPITSVELDRASKELRTDEERYALAG